MIIFKFLVTERKIMRTTELIMKIIMIIKIIVIIIMS